VQALLGKTVWPLATEAPQVNPLLSLLQAGALGYAEGILRGGASLEQLSAALVRAFPLYSPVVSAQVADIAYSAFIAGQLVSELAPGEVLPRADIPIMPGVPARTIEADVAIDWRGPAGNLESSRITITGLSEADLEEIQAQAEAAFEVGLDGSPPVETGATFLESRVIGVYRGV
jgi:hypothetical protein